VGVLNKRPMSPTPWPVSGLAVYLLEGIMTTFVKCASHRARERLFNALGRQMVGYWSTTRNTFHGVYAINDSELPKARTVKGITKCRGDTSDLAKCWT